MSAMAAGGIVWLQAEQRPAKTRATQKTGKVLERAIQMTQGMKAAEPIKNVGLRPMV